MRKLTTIALVVGALLAALPAQAAVIHDNGTCTQADGQNGLWNGYTGTDDINCVTPAEYADLYSVPNLIAEGVVDAAILNDDGTTTITFADTGVTKTITAEPLDRVVSANAELEPDAPTVREWFASRAYPV